MCVLNLRSDILFFLANREKGKKKQKFSLFLDPSPCSEKRTPDRRLVCCYRNLKVLVACRLHIIIADFHVVVILLQLSEFRSFQVFFVISFLNSQWHLN